MSVMRPLFAAAALAIVAGCASVPQAQRQATYEAAAGAPVKSFRFFNPLWSWEPLGRDQVVIYTKPKEAWLLDVPGCNGLPFATAIGLTSNLNQVSVRFDKVLTGRHDFPCTITRIRPLDVAKVKAAQQSPRPIDTAPRTP